MCGPQLVYYNPLDTRLTQSIQVIPPTLMEMVMAVVPEEMWTQDED